MVGMANIYEYTYMETGMKYFQPKYSNRTAHPITSNLTRALTIGLEAKAQLSRLTLYNLAFVL